MKKLLFCVMAAIGFVASSPIISSDIDPEAMYTTYRQRFKNYVECVDSYKKAAKSTLKYAQNQCYAVYKGSRFNETHYVPKPILTCLEKCFSQRCADKCLAMKVKSNNR